MHKRQIYQIAESNRNLFCPNWNALAVTRRLGVRRRRGFFIGGDVPSYAMRACWRAVSSIISVTRHPPTDLRRPQDSPARPSCHASCVHTSPALAYRIKRYHARHAAAFRVTATRAGKPCCVRRGLSSCRSDGRFNGRSHYALIRASAV